jgi:hypothetical protein
MVDKMHVVHAGGAGGHAGEAGQAAVDVLDHLFVRRPVVLQHVLDEVDPAARRVELIAERHIGRAGRRAEAAVHAFADDAFGFGDSGIGELRRGEGGLHLENSQRWGRRADIGGQPTIVVEHKGSSGAQGGDDSGDRIRRRCRDFSICCSEHQDSQPPGRQGLLNWQVPVVGDQQVVPLQFSAI